MGKRPNCRSCRHCAPPKDAEMGWCQLRQLAIHSDLVGELWCHHWTASPPRLPAVVPGGVAAAEEPKSLTSQQLSLSGLPKDLSTL
ncbi:MAG: hypothetical protein ACKOYK_01390 [Cyanobium sp.]